MVRCHNKINLSYKNIIYEYVISFRRELLPVKELVKREPITPLTTLSLLVIKFLVNESGSALFSKLHRTADLDQSVTCTITANQQKVPVRASGCSGCGHDQCHMVCSPCMKTLQELLTLNPTPSTKTPPPTFFSNVNQFDWNHKTEVDLLEIP